jgi:hypothetical protein
MMISVDLKCDYCSSGDVAFRYPARTFEGETVETLTQVSIGDWCACGICHKMIQRDDRAGLAVRSLNLMILEDPEAASDADELYRMIVDLQAKFFNNRTGEPVPIETRAA